MGVIRVYSLQCMHLKRSLLQTKTFFLILWSSLSSEVGQHLKAQILSWRGKTETKHRSDLYKEKSNKNAVFWKLRSTSDTRSLDRCQKLVPFVIWLYGHQVIWFSQFAVYHDKSVCTRKSAKFWPFPLLRFLPNVKAENSFNKIWGQFWVWCNAPIPASVGHRVTEW